ncbi:MAG: formyltetrahydrofolate deformylase [Fusobacteria bacterium]|nr:formyltetrahydrofolate deformylase [Fusobacteriota bacterium]
MDKNCIIRIDSPDEKGLIYKITKILYENNLNIVSNGEYVDNETNHFFMRTEISGDFDNDKIYNEIKSILPENAKIKFSKPEKKRVVLLATKEHHCLGDLLIKNQYNEFNIEILAVISNYSSLKDLVDKFNIPFITISHENLEREDHEKLIIEKIKELNPEYIVLAKYMRILTPTFVSAFPEEIINIHHSFLPAFIGANPYKQAYERGVKLIGATSHFVNNDLDDGPIITQEVISINHTYNAQTMRKAGQEVEKIVLAKALKLVFEERVFLNNNKTIIL